MTIDLTQAEVEILKEMISLTEGFSKSESKLLDNISKKLGNQSIKIKKFKGETSEYGEYLIKELDNALSQYGLYTYSDKGAYEVLDIDKFVKDLSGKTPVEIGVILKYVMDKREISIGGGGLVDSIVGQMDNRGDFEEILNQDERIEY